MYFLRSAPFEIPIRPPNRVDIFTAVEGVQFEDAWQDRVEVDIEGLRIPVISRSHLIANKRTVGRPQDLLDADLLERMKGQY